MESSVGQHQMESRRSLRALKLLNWLLVPVALLIVSALLAVLLRVSKQWESVILVTALDALLCAAPGFFVAFLGGHSYLLIRSRGVLLLGTGGLVLAFAYLLGSCLTPTSPDGVTVRSTCLLLAAALFAAGAVYALRHGEAADKGSAAGGPARTLAAAYGGAAVLVAAIAAAAANSLMPTYLTSQGLPNVLGRAVLGLDALILLATFLLFAAAVRRWSSPVHAGVAAGVCALAVSLAVLALAQAAPGSVTLWLARAGQWLGGLCLLVGVSGLRRPLGEQALVKVACAAVEPAVHGRGEAVQMLVVDAPLRRETQAAIQAQEQQFRALVERAPLGIFVQVNGLFAYLNEAAKQLFRVPKGVSLVGEPVIQRIHPDYREQVAERIRISNEEQREVPMNDEVILTLAGEALNVETTAVPFTYQGSEGALVFMSDITERKRRVDEATRLNRILDGSLNEVYLFDAETLRFVQVNQGARRNLGYTMEELRRMTPLDLKLPLDKESFYEMLDLLRSGREQVQVFFTEHQRKDGSFYPVEVHLQYTAEETQPMYVAIVMDISERRQAAEALAQSEEQLRQSQKMEAIGRLAGGIAHDFNNLLTAIIGYSDLILAQRAELDDQTREDVSEIRRVAERAGALTKQILAFSRKQPLQPQVVSLNQVLSNVEPLLRRTLGEDIELHIHKNPQLGLVEVDVQQMEQAVLNLVVNARDAMPYGGFLSLETADIEIEEDYCRAHADASPGSYVMLTVSDTGMGMDEQTMSHIFEPFFTTKAPGKGTGLGLSTVYGIVKQSGGMISVYSEPGEGTSFKIYLPRVSSRIDPAPPLTPVRPSASGQNRILVVEDEMPVRSMVSRILRELGYEVISAGSAKEALTLVAALQEPPDLVLTDVVLPGDLQGTHLVQELLALWPDLPVLYMSGFAPDTVVHIGRLDKGADLISKPFTPDSLAAKVAEVLGRRSQNRLC